MPIVTPSNISTDEFMHLAQGCSFSSATRTEFLVKVWNAAVRKWQRCQDAEIVRQGEQVSRECMAAEPAYIPCMGDTVWLGDINGARVLVEIK